MIVQAQPSLKFIAIADRGDLNNERVHFEATRDSDSQFYFVLASHDAGGGRVFAGARPCYWFESQDLKVGDNLILYTKAGLYSKQLRPDGHFNHFFYWGNPVALYGTPTACVVIADLNSWQMAR